AGLQDQNSPLVFYPVASQVVTRTNTTSVVADYKFSDRSTISIRASQNVRDYIRSGGIAGGTLTNQLRISGDVTYAWQASKNETFSVGYTTDYFNFTSSEDAYSDL